MPDDPHGIVRLDGGWRVPYTRGLGLGQIVLGSDLRFRFGSSELTLYGSAELADDGGAHELSAAPPRNLARVADLLNQIVAELDVHDDGTLSVLFANGWLLLAPPAAADLRWAFFTPEGWFASRPGGGVNVSLRYDRRTI